MFPIPYNHGTTTIATSFAREISSWSSSPIQISVVESKISHGVVLVTTRNKQTGSRLTKGNRPIEVGRMDDDETAHLLRARLDGVDACYGESSVLSSRLEHFPLALVQAAAFMQETYAAIRALTYIIGERRI
jgi:hypothetical protein